MKVIKIDLKTAWQDESIIQQAVEIIQRNGSLVYPTDTVYGLGVNAWRAHCLERLFKMKKRPEDKPVPVIVRDLEMAKELARVNRAAEKILRAIWPGAVTVILPKQEIVPDILTAGQPTIGLRIADCRLVQAIMDKLDCPLTATSANFSGQPPLTSSEEIIESFNHAYPRPDLILAAGQLTKISPSTVLDLSGPQPKILRIGPVNKKELLQLLQT